MSGTDAVPSRAKLPWGTKAIYGLGSASFGIKDQGFATFLLLFYNQVVGLPAAWVGAAIMAVMILDALVDPAIGHWSDNLQSRWGRRHPFMYAALVPMGISYALVWTPPDAAQEWQLLYMIVTTFAVRVSISFFEIPNAALMSELTSDYGERTSLAAHRAIWNGVISMTVMLVTFKVLMHTDDPGAYGQLDAAVYREYGAFAAAGIFACAFLSSIGTHRRGRQLPQIESAAEISLGNILRGLGQIIFDKTCSSIIWCSFFVAVAAGVYGALNVYILTFFWNLSPDQVGTLSVAMVAGIVIALLITMASNRTGKKNMLVAMILMAILAFNGLITLKLLGFFPQGLPHLVPTLSLQAVVIGACIFSILIIGPSMIADLAEHIQVKTGTRMDGLLFSTMVMINKSVSGIGIFVSGLILSAIGFPEHAQPGTVDATVISQLGWVYVAGLCVFLGLSALTVSFYPITRQSHEAMVNLSKPR